MRLIDGDALARALFDHNFSVPVLENEQKVLSEALRLIHNAPTECEAYRSFCVAKQRPHGEWIPVSEGLPDNDGGCYLVSLDNGQIVVADSGGIIENHDFEPKMLAWQPLPEPYKKGGADMRGDKE